MSESDISSAYNKIADRYYHGHTKHSYRFGSFLKFLNKGDKILELGCGPGVDARCMVDKGIDVLGYDLSSKMIKIAKQICPQGKFEVRDMRSINFPINSFKAVVASFSIIHLPKKDVLPLFKKINKILLPHGYLYIGIQEGESAEGMVPGKSKEDDKFFLNVMSEKEAFELLKEANFVILKDFRREAHKKEWPYRKHVFIAQKI